MGIYAQDDDALNCEFTVYGKEEFGTPTVKRVEYARFKTVKTAQKYLDILRSCMDDETGEKFNNAKIKYNIKFRRANGNGTFNIKAYPGQAILLNVDEGNGWKVVEIVPGKTEYKGEDGKGEIVRLQAKDVGEIYKYGKAKVLPPPPPPSLGGNPVRVPVKVDIPAEYIGNNTRVIIQPIAINCQTEDTVGYVKPLVYEGKRYHTLQDLRMQGDFYGHEHDSIASGYVSGKYLSENDTLRVDTILLFKKINDKDQYKFFYNIVAEDYSHVKYSYSQEGSCNGLKFFKFLNLSDVGADMNIEDFRKEAEETTKKVPRNLKLNFLRSKSELVQDSLNNQILKLLTDEMRSKGELLESIEIQAFSSPDGGYEKNLKLADERGKETMKIIMSHLGNVEVNKNTKPGVVHTWEEVVEELERKGRNSQADSLRTLISMGSKTPDMQIKALPFYTTSVEPILEDMRSVRCTYSYEDYHVMDQSEVVEYYNNNKKKLFAGDKSVKLSDGDYYNLFYSEDESIDMDSLTVHVYNIVTSNRDYYLDKFALYVCNRMAKLQLRRGNPDLDILKPYIDYTSPNVTSGRFEEEYGRNWMNRKEVLINQIAAYYQLEKTDSARYLLDAWFSNPRFQNDEQYKKLREFVDFKDGFYRRYIDNSMPESEYDTYKILEDRVLNADPDNRAALYTEARLYMHKTDQDCLELINNMDDSNPKKWYLWGIIFSSSVNLNIKQPEEDALKYLACFYKSFTMQPEYYKLYLNEGQINEDLRKKYRFRNADIPLYNDIITNLMSKEKTEDLEISGGAFGDE